MGKTALKYQDPKDFWRTIKNLKGSKIQHNQYLLVNNNKLTNDQDKEEAYKNIWKEVFKISPPKNMDFDRESAREVESYIDTNQIKVTTFQRSDLNRLLGANITDSLITNEEMTEVIKKFNNNTPGENNINKAILKKTFLTQR